MLEDDHWSVVLELCEMLCYVLSMSIDHLVYVASSPLALSSGVCPVVVSLLHNNGF